MPPATLDAFRDHGQTQAGPERAVDAPEKTMDDLSRVGISMKAVTDELTQDGVRLFAEVRSAQAAVDQRVGNVAAPPASR